MIPTQTRAATRMTYARDWRRIAVITIGAYAAALAALFVIGLTVIA